MTIISLLTMILAYGLMFGVLTYLDAKRNQKREEKSKELDDEAVNQMEMHYMTYINSVPEWELVDVYVDEGLSGLRNDNRLEFQRMLQDCKLGRINRILTKSVSRFSRNKQQALSTILELKELGVSVFFENDHIDTGDLSSTTLFSLAAALAEQESVEISRNVRMGIQSRMRRGTYIPGAVPYGYQRTNSQLVLDAVGAPVIQRLFGEYLSGAGLERIAHKQNEDEIPGPNGKGWNTCAIRYILTNRIYTGDCLWQKNFTTDTVPFHSQRNRGQQKQYLVHASHAPIITNKDLFGDGYKELLEEINHALVA